MLFLFEESAPHGFWMKNTLIPLDMIFIGEDGRIVGIVESATPGSTALRDVGAPSRYVLEVNGGWSAARGVRPGDGFGSRASRGSDLAGCVRRFATRPVPGSRLPEQPARELRPEAVGHERLDRRLEVGAIAAIRPDEADAHAGRLPPAEEWTTSPESSNGAGRPGIVSWNRNRCPPGAPCAS